MSVIKAGTLYRMFDGRMDADVYVNIEGTYIPVVSARYDPGEQPQVIIGLDRLKVLILLEMFKTHTEENL